jgi:hypothetical protein
MTVRVCEPGARSPKRVSSSVTVNVVDPSPMMARTLWEAEVGAPVGDGVY